MNSRTWPAISPPYLSCRKCPAADLEGGASRRDQTLERAGGAAQNRVLRRPDQLGRLVPLGQGRARPAHGVGDRAAGRGGHQKRPRRRAGLVARGRERRPVCVHEPGLARGQRQRHQRTDGETLLEQPHARLPRPERPRRRLVAGRQERVHDDQPLDPVRHVEGADAEPHQPAPILNHQRHVLEVEVLDHAQKRGPVERVAVVRDGGRLVAAAEPGEVERDRAVSGPDERRDHAAVEVAPRRLAVQHQDGLSGVAWPLVHDVQPQRAGRAGDDLEVDVLRLVGPVLEVGEAGVGRAGDAGREVRHGRGGDRGACPGTRSGA